LLAYDIETGANDQSQTYFEKYADVQAPSNYKDPDKIKSYIEEKRKSLWDGSALKPYTGQVVCISACRVKLPLGTVTKITDVEQMFGIYSPKSSYAKLRDYAWMLGIDGKHMDGAMVPQLIQEMRAGGPDHWDKIVPYCERDVEIVVDMIIRYFQTKTSKPEPGEMMSFYGLDEYTVLNQFFDWIESQRDPSNEFTEATSLLKMIGKASRSFDRPFLVGRAMANNIPMPEELRHG
jgi:hypothetical protein